MAANRSTNAQELAESILSLYDVSTPSDDVIAKYYLPDAVFTDPMLTVTGLENIQAQFRALPKFIKSSKATLVRGSMAGSAVLTIDSSVAYRLKPFPSFMKVTMRQFTVIELRNAKVASHTDHWDFYSVLSNIPLLSFFYAKFRPLFGAASSSVIKRLVAPPPAASALTSSPTHTKSNGVKAATAGAGAMAVATQ
ncbi:hypothetical protein PybrP1_007412 [[Pythium] brassicae (nom. inval.)]|nr:hypothetical protein PybrP1_007412 [[Pythium] brassicae (nom. inval.)]